MGFLWSQLFVTPTYPTASFSGQTVIVTGANVGLGKEAARHFARLGAEKVILAVRNLPAGEAARRDIERTTRCGPGVVEAWQLDLGSYASVVSFASRASAGLARIDVLCENAGVATVSRWHFDEGHERSVTVNVISTFLLALLLLPKLRSTAREFDTRTHLSIVSSGAHGAVEFPERRAAGGIFAALDDETRSKIENRYGVTKLLEVLVVRELAPRLQGTGVVLNVIAPGFCRSELARELGWTLYGIQVMIMKVFIARTTEVGSRTLVAGATAGEESHGKYMHDGVVAEGEVSYFAKSEEGVNTGAAVWNELSAILEAIQPGVTNSLRSG